MTHAALLKEAQSLMARRLYAPAERALKKALKGAAGDYPLYEALAYARHAQADIEGALSYLQKASAADPKQPGAPFNRGVMLAQLNCPTEAAEMFARVIALAPDNPAAWQGRADALAATGDWTEALAAYDGALAREPNHPGALMGRGVMLGRLGRHGEALAAFDAVLVLSPKIALAHYNRGRSLAALYKYSDAVAAYDCALALKPDHADAWINRGVALEGLNRRAEALAAYGEAENAARRVGADPAPAIFNRATLLLAAGDYGKGFALYPSRAFTLKPSRVARALNDKPMWRGERLDGVLRVWSEQGIGDEILFAGLIPLVLQRTPRVVWECEPRLAGLIARSFPDLEAVRAQNAPCAEFDAQISAADLGAVLGLQKPADIPSPRLWQADPALTAKFRARYEKMAEGRSIIGVAWRSKAPDGALRGPDLSHWGALLTEEYFFVSLQYGDVRESVAAADAAFGAAPYVDPEVDQMRDMEGFFAQVAALDGVVSILNTTLHVAGALGKPTLALVPPGRGLHWYWGFAGDACAWHPSLTLVRRALDAPWEEQIADAARQLAHSLT